MIKRRTFGIKKKATMPLTPLKRPTTRRRRKKGELTKLKEKLWELCRLIIREKYGNTCYTCNKGPLTGSSWQTGHFITSSNCSVELRFDLKNLAVQCYNCNINKSGNWVVFEKLLKDKYGNEYVEELKARNLATKGMVYPISWFQQKIELYIQILASLQSQEVPPLATGE